MAAGSRAQAGSAPRRPCLSRQRERERGQPPFPASGRGRRRFERGSAQEIEQAARHHLGGPAQVLENQVTLLTDRAQVATGGREGAAALADELKSAD